MTIGEKIQKLLKDKGLNQTEFSVLLDVKYGRLNHWLNDIHPPPLIYAFQMSRFFGVSLDYLVDDSIDDPTGKIRLTDDQRRLMEMADVLGQQSLDLLLRFLSFSERDLLGFAPTKKPGPGVFRDHPEENDPPRGNQQGTR